MSERLSITPLGPYIGAQISGADLTRPLSDNQFEQLYHAVLRHQVVFLRDQAITPQQQRALAQRFGELHIHPVYPHAEGVDEIIVLDTHNDNPPLWQVIRISIVLSHAVIPNRNIIRLPAPAHLKLRFSDMGE